MAHVFFAFLCACLAGAQGKTAPEFDINLDAAPEVRFTEVVTHFNASIYEFYNKFLHSIPAKAVLFGLSAKRGKENAELQAEIEGIAKLTQLPEYGIHTVQFLYELQTLMVPIVNFTAPWHGPGCTGILAKNSADGMVYHARNLDFTPAHYMQDLIYVGIFKKGGREVFRAQMIASYQFPPTGMKKGPNGFTIEQNTRYLDHEGGNTEFLKRLLDEKVEFAGWTRRKVFENAADYETAVETLATTPYISTEYNIVGGVRKGTILARNPRGLAYKMVLGERNYQCRDDYIIITNFDYVYHDIREWFDPTEASGKGLGHPRRIAAQKLLNSSAVLTPEVLTTVINDVGVAAKETIFNGIMNVETGLWNMTLPACVSCGGKKETVVVV
jgi:hypothetical protein